MASKQARRTMMYLKNTVGTVNQLPRLVNYNQTPPQYLYGYIDVNTNATTPFSRGKVHKGFIAGVTDDNVPVTVTDGDLFLDRYDNYHYFVMSRKGKYFNGETAYYDATMYRCDIQVDVYRFEQGTRDAFGRPLTATPTKITTAGKVWAMSNPLNYDILQQKDRLVAQDKIEICLQSSVGVRTADRLVTAGGDTFIVQTVDTTSLTNLVLCGVDTDVR